MSKRRKIEKITTVNGLASLASMKDIEKELECPVCYGIPLPPIYNCEKGHIVCNRCRPRLKECSLCRSPFTVSRNLSMESIIMSSKFYCNHRDQGCKKEMTAEELQNHHDHCAFQPTECYFSSYNGCSKGHLVYLPEYVKHLEDHHKYKVKSPCVTGSKMHIFEIYYVIQGSRKAFFENLCGDWSGTLMNFNKSVFVGDVFSRGSFLYFRLALIGNKDEAAKYRVKITLQGMNNSKLPLYELTTMVPSIQDLQVKKEMSPEDYPVAVVSRNLIESVGSVDLTSNAPFGNLKWRVIYEIQIAKVAAQK